MGSMPAKCVFTLLALLTLCVAPDQLSAQAGVVTGVVTDEETGRAVMGATVRALTAGEQPAGSAITNAEGRYRLSLAPGSYNLAAEMVGYEVLSGRPVTVAAGGTVSMNLTLRTSAFALNPVVVTVSRTQEKSTDAPARVEVISRREIEERPAITPVDHLRSVPGVDVITTGLQSTNVAVRGFNNIFSGSLHTLTDNRIAGIPSLRVNLMHFVPQTNEDLERMEVVLGPGAALYGPNTANGVLHLITKSPLNETGTTLTVAGGERGMLHGTARSSQRISDNLGVKLSAQYLRANEWEYYDSVEVQTARLAAANPAAFRALQPRDVDGTPLTDEEVQDRIARVGARDFDIERWSGDVRADWRVTPEVTAIFSAGLTNSGSGVELTGIGAGQVNDWQYGYYQGRLNWRRVFAQAYLNTSDAGETFLLRSGAPIVDKSKVFVSQLQNGFDIGGRQDFIYGVDYIATMPETEGTIHGTREEDDNFTELGAYLQSRTSLLPQLDLVLAGRGDRHSVLDKWVFSPRAALVYTPVEDQSVRLTYNRAFSTPSSLNLFLEIDAGPAPSALGQLGYRLRAQGPGAQGFSFRTASGDLHGIRSPFAAGVGKAPTDLIAPTPQALYNLQITGFFAASAAQGRPIPASLQTYMRALANDPTLSSIAPLLLDPLNPTQPVPLATAPLNPIPGIEESRNESFELGYKGVIADRLVLAADAWVERRENFVSPLILQTSLTLLNPQGVNNFLIPRLMVAGVSQAQAEAIAAGVAQIPGGVISSPDINAAGADLLVTYRNMGEVDISGFDLSASYLVTDLLQVGASASFVSDYYFTLEAEGLPNQPVALNAPKRKGTGTITYRDMPRGLHGEFRVRYNGEFPANSAGYIGTRCITGLPTDEECVQSYTLLDLNLGYELRRFPGASVQLNITNLLDEPYQSFTGTATVGRLALLRLKYEF